MRGLNRPTARPADRAVLVLLTHPIHVELFRPVGRALAERGITPIIVDGETRSGRSVEAAGIDARLVDRLGAGAIPSLLVHLARIERGLRSVPEAWANPPAADRPEALRAVLHRGLGLAALDAARLRALIRAARPHAVACFSESGILARIAPSVAHAEGIPAIDLPHGEANDPFGTAGVEYDAMLVYGPRSRMALEAAGIAHGRIVEIGPLRYDRLIRTDRIEPAPDRHRVVFAAQPADPDRPAIRPAVKASALEAAAAMAGALAPAELCAVPHPTEPGGETQRFLASSFMPSGVEARVVSDLHATLRGASVLVTASSQSVFDAVVAGIPAVTVRPAEDPVAVTFASEGISAEVRTAEEAAALARTLSVPERRHALVEAQRRALGNRIGPLDGQAAMRAAAHIETLLGRES